MCSDECRGRHKLRDSEGRFRAHGTPAMTAWRHSRNAYLAYLESRYQAAEKATRGHMLTMKGARRGVRTDAWFTLRPPGDDRYASPELREWLDNNPLLTESEYIAWSQEEQWSSM